MGAVVVTYRRPAVLLKTLDQVRAQTHPPDHIVIVDNDDDADVRSAVEAGDLRVDYLGLGENVGYSGGLAHGMRFLRARYRPDWYWLLDDDSPPAPIALESSLAFAGNENVGVVGNRGGRIRWGRIRHDLHHVIGQRAHPADFCLTDGALVSATAATAVGYPRADFFIMLEDVEFTTRVREAGFTVLVRPADGSNYHYLGSGGAWRGYYQSRNHLRMAIDRRSPMWAWSWATRELGFLIALVRRGKWVALGLRWRGAVDALRGRMGRQLEPASQPPTRGAATTRARYSVAHRRTRAGRSAPNPR